MTQDRGLLKNGVFSQAHIYFKDTVVINKWYKGKVFYKSLLDTLKLTKKDDRFITLFVNAGSVITQSRDIKKIPHDSLSSDNDTIYFKVIFKELGNNYLNAHMKDEVYMESSQAKDEVRHIVKFSSFDMPVYVIENSEK